MSTVQVTILAAGMGTRLGRPFPKSLTPLSDGRSIMQHQVTSLERTFTDDLHLTIVVGFKMELVMEAQPQAVFVYNENFDRTNTNKSLLKALRASQEGGVLWMNGDVVFDVAILQRVRSRIEADTSFVAVNTSAVADEEVKYTVDPDGYVLGLSKTVTGGLGEAVGINYISSADKAALTARLDECDDQDYFERGLELAVEKDGIRLEPVDISDLYAVEVDFEEDLARANEAIGPR